jgi:hypothetical protein
MENWLRFLLQEYDTLIHSNDNEWPLIQMAEQGTVQELDRLKELTEYIKTPQTILVIKGTSLDDHRENIILHPYCILIHQSVFYLKGFSDKSEQLADIPISQIRKVTGLPDVKYRKPNTQEIRILKSITANSIATKSKKKQKNIAGYKNFWGNFSNSNNQKYIAGSRDLWYNEILSLKFFKAKQYKLKAYFEVCCQFGPNKRLIINIIIESKLSKDPKIEELVDLFKKLGNDLAEAGFSDVKWEKRTGDKRHTIQLCTKRLKVDEGSELQDPRKSPEQPQHFKWFSEKLDALTEIFQQHLEPS